MKYNHQIDFFSSPNSKFIGFSDIRHPQIEINNQNEVVFQSIEEERKMCRKLSFSASNMVDPIVPFGNDFFQEKLEECEEHEEYNEHRDHYIQENSLMMDAHFRLNNPIQKPPMVKLKEPDFLCTPNTMRIQCEDMPQFEKKQDSVECKIQSNRNEIYTTPKRKSQFFMVRKSCESTAEKSMSRNNEKGLRRLSSLAYSIVSQSSTTTYKEVAQKLLSHLNFNSNDMEDEDGAEKNSMQNVKRRVYDSLNVLLALGVIKRVGSKIAKQKQRKPFTADNSPDLEKYNEMVMEYNERVKALQTRKRTEKELKQKLQFFKKAVERNKKLKLNGKNKIIKLPFLVFAAKEEGQVQWVKKEVSENFEKKKVAGKRSQGKEYEKEKSRENDLMVKVTFKGYPDSYGDLDFFKLLNMQHVETQISECLNSSKQMQVLKIANLNSHQIEEFEYPVDNLLKGSYNGSNGQMMNLIDEVLRQE